MSVVLSVFLGGIFYLVELPIIFPFAVDLYEPLSFSNAFVQVMTITIVTPIFDQVLYRGIVLRRLLNTSMNGYLAI